ncbi:Potassium voltage-gated channel subfamily G member 1 [Acropora cervicornis]|uniref:Potassium voltage-gated channel subfamily G member 1 n=1 Tax=Acropora cervicornis TaxID=6130 RepID=A0AAD9V7M1_ACRCE|nr:Potassium voltage-gated channel subfamily G member 1 [Acropora cervicornis]
MEGCRTFSLLAFSISILSASLHCLASSFQYACDNVTSFPLTYWEHRPYVFTDHDGSTITGALPKIIRQTLKSCCRKEPSISGKRLQYPVSLRDIIKNNHDEVIVPVGRRSGHGGSVFLRPYLRLIDSPGMAVIVPKTIPGEDLIAAIFDSWPILIFIVMSVSLSAIAMWALECGLNPGEFPKFFPKGVFESFWWASVTMTTVGYGDKVPRGVFGRLFAVVWINVGLVILAIFMGMITASLSSNSLEQTNNLYGIPVSVMNGTAEQQLAILQNAEVHVFDDDLHGLFEGVLQKHKHGYVLSKRAGRL